MGLWLGQPSKRSFDAAGMKSKVAVVAAMRKLVILMNRLLHNPKFQLAN